jgi:hypothetical protein
MTLHFFGIVVGRYNNDDIVQVTRSVSNTVLHSSLTTINNAMI